MTNKKNNFESQNKVIRFSERGFRVLASLKFSMECKLGCTISISTFGAPFVIFHVCLDTLT